MAETLVYWDKNKIHKISNPKQHKHSKQGEFSSGEFLEIKTR
jgi:hypothetical protein